MEFALIRRHDSYLKGYLIYVSRTLANGRQNCMAGSCSPWGAPSNCGRISYASGLLRKTHYFANFRGSRRHAPSFLRNLVAIILWRVKNRASIRLAEMRVRSQSAVEIKLDGANVNDLSIPSLS